MMNMHTKFKVSSLSRYRDILGGLKIVNGSQQKGAWLWSRDCFQILPFVVMQRVARVCQRQLSYLLDIAAAVRGDAGRENVTYCGATSRRIQHR